MSETYWIIRIESNKGLTKVSLYDSLDNLMKDYQDGDIITRTIPVIPIPVE